MYVTIHDCLKCSNLCHSYLPAPNSIPCWLLQFNDGSMLAITLAKYKLMFDEVDTSGNGTLGAAEVQHFFQK